MRERMADRRGHDPARLARSVRACGLGFYVNGSRIKEPGNTTEELPRWVWWEDEQR
jgi:hypothetical protein